MDALHDNDGMHRAKARNAGFWPIREKSDRQNRVSKRFKCPGLAPLRTAEMG